VTTPLITMESRPQPAQDFSNDGSFVNVCRSCVVGQESHPAMAKTDKKES
jgi:hypothetical protein